MAARLSTQYGFSDADIKHALDKHDGVELVGERDPALALPGAVRCERDLLKVVKKLSASPLRRRSTAREINEKFQGLQRKAIETILTNGICAITGGPGTGKTTICAEVASQLKDALGIALAARAARNLADRSRAPAMTIARFLYLAKRNGTVHPYRALIVDEASMIGTKQLWEILRIAEKAEVKRIALVGDADQLPPIEWGRPFADLIEGNALPAVRLTENRRTDADGGIARLASDMRLGLSPYPSFATYGSVTLTDVSNAEEALYRVQRSYMRLRQGGASFSDIAVLSPYRDPKVPLSSERLNRAIRQSLGMAASKASVGEIVIATQNDYENNAINGVRGVVKTSDENGLTVQFDGINDIASYGNDELREHGLPDGVGWGYAYSVHKAQGSEFRHVIVVVSEEMARLFGKPALYTAVTRARESLTIIGDLFSSAALRVRQGALEIEDGPQGDKRSIRLDIDEVPPRAILFDGRGEFLTGEAIRWCAQRDIALILPEGPGRTVAFSRYALEAGDGAAALPDTDPAVIRAQCAADVVGIGREIVRAKIEAEAAHFGRFDPFNANAVAEWVRHARRLERIIERDRHLS